MGTIKDLRLIQCFAWFLLIFWLVAGTHLQKGGRDAELLKDKRTTQEKLTKTRLMQNIDNDNPYQSILPILPGQQPYSVQFEPLAHVRLSRSTYKVTTFIEFKPYIDSFKNFQAYLELFLEDMADPRKTSGFSRLLTRHLEDVEEHPDDDLMTRIITNKGCHRSHATWCAKKENRYGGGRDQGEAECLRQMQIICRAQLQFEAIVNATKYIRSAYNQVHEEFLSVIDHLETESEEQDDEVRSQHNEKVEEELRIAYSKVSKEEMEVLDDIIGKVAAKYPELNRKIIKRVKRFGIMSWIMGWGVYSNMRQIKSIKRNIKKTLFAECIAGKDKYKIWPTI